MKKLSILLSLFIVFNSCFSQPIVNRAGAANTVQDARWKALYNAVAPIYNDTVTANIQKGVDSCAAIIQTRSPRAFWRRECYPSKHWVRFLDVENFSQFIDTAQEQAVTNISIINQVGDIVSIQVCTGADACDTITVNSTTIDNAQSVYLLDNNTIVICDTIPVCDTIDIPEQPIFYYAQNGINTLNGNIFEHGGFLLHNTQLNTGYFNYNIYGYPAYNYPLTVTQDQASGSGSGVASFLHTGVHWLPLIDQYNTVKLGINYTSAEYPDNPSNLPGYFNDKIGYMFGVNTTGFGSYGMSIDNGASKVGGIFVHTLDTTYKDAVTIYGAKPPLATAAWNLQPNTMDSTRIAIFKHDKQIQFKGYGAGTRTAVPNTISGWDANGNFVEVDTSGIGGHTTILNDTTIIICSFGTNLCDTIYVTNGGAGTVESVGLSMPSAFTVTNSPVTTSGTLTVTGAGTTAQYIRGDGTLATFPTIPSGANPTASIGLTAINGVATTFLRSDAAQALSQAIVPTWTGVHTFDNNLLMLTSRLEETKGADVTAANDLTLGADGNLFTITGATQINAITTTSWQAGSEIGFIFTGAPTLKNNTAGGASTATMLLSGRVDYVAAAGDYIAFKYDGTNWYETQRKLAATTGIFTGITADNGITANTSSNVQLGSLTDAGVPLAASRYINTGANSLVVNTGTASANPLTVISTTGTGIDITTTSGTGIWSKSTTSGFAGQFNSIDATAIAAIRNPSSTNTIVPVLQLSRNTQGTGANGLGGSIDLYAESSTSETIANQFIWKWTDATHASRTSQLSVKGMLNAVSVDVFTMNGDGSIQLRPITATAASAITPAEGMLVFASSTDATFTSIGLWCYENGAWSKK